MSFLPLTRVNFVLLGAWRQNGIICGVYVAVVAVLAGLMYRSTPPAEHATVSSVFLSLIGIIQGVLALLIAPGAIRKAVLRDHQVGMIESHRLTPLSGLDLVLGYLTGPAAQAILMFATGTVLGTYFAAAFGGTLGAAGGFVASWYVAQAGLALLSLLVCTLVLAVALSTAGKANLLPLLILLGVFGGWFAILLVPGVALISGVMSVGAMLSWLGAPVPRNDPSVTAWASLLHIVFAAILIAASSRKVRRPHLPLFTIPLGLALLLATGAGLIVGWQYFGEFARLFDYGDVGVTQWIGSLFTFVLMALFPIISAATERFHADRAALIAGRRPRRLHSRDAVPVLLLALAAVLLCVILPRDPAMALDAAVQPWQPAGSALSACLRYLAAPIAALGLTLWIDYAWLYVVIAIRGRSLFWPVVVAWFVLRVAPLLAQVAVLAVNEMTMARVEPNWVLAGLSPIGTLVLVTVDEPGGGPADFVPGTTFAAGLAVQALIACAMTWWACRSRGRLRFRAVAATASAAGSRDA